MSFKQPDIDTIQKQADTFAAQLSDYIEPDLSPLWEILRNTDVPYIPILFRDELETAHSLCGKVLRTIGKASIGAAYALENHLYVLGGIEMYLSMCPNKEVRARLDDILAKRQYLANTHGYLHTERAFTEGISVKSTDQGMVVDGLGHFVSFSQTADVLFLTLVDCPDPMALLFPIKDDPRIKFGDYYFPNILLESDTRSMKCEGVVIPLEFMFDVERDHLLPGGTMSVALLGWHLTLSSSAFLGGASYIIDQTLEFAKSFKTFDGRLLSRLDDIVPEFGKIGIRYGTAEALINEYTRSLSMSGCAHDHSASLKDGLLRAQIANCQTMELTEEISQRCRRLLGTRIFSPSYAKFEKVTAELLIGPLVPRNNAILKKDVGYRILTKRRFDGNRW